MEEFIRTLVIGLIFIGLFTLSFYLLSFLERKKAGRGIVKFPFVSIIIPAYNEEKNLAKTVESVIGLDYPKDKLEVLIVNDGSKDKTGRIARELARKYSGFNLRVFDKENGGKGSALNYGIKRAHGEIIVGFDADSMVVRNALRDMIPHFSDPDVVCVTPALKVYKPKGILQRVQAIEYDLGIFLRRAFANINAVHVAPGPFSAFRKKFFDKHGGFDEKNITEDLEIAMRIQSLNYRIENAPTALVYTISPRKFLPLVRQRRRWYFGLIKNILNYRYLFGRRYGELGLIVFPLAVLSILSTMIITLYYLYKGISGFVADVGLYNSIGFDIANNLNFNSYLFAVNIYKIFSDGIVLFGIFFFISTLLLLLITNKKVSSIDRPISTFISYVIFIFFYSILFTFWWGIALAYSLTHRNIKW